MQLSHSFDVPRAADSVYNSLLDLELVTSCMPGATLTSLDGDTFEGTMKLKLGPIVMTYQGTAEYVEKDPVGHRLVLAASGRDSRGNGTAATRIAARLEAVGPSLTRVLVDSDLDITGKPAQFGRGLIKDVGDKLLGQFAGALAERLSVAEERAETRAETRASTIHAAADVRPQSVDSISLTSLVGPVVVKRLLPAVGALLLLVWIGSRGIRRR
ncbi:SRPBCC family protein [Nocardioides sp. AN3]